LANIQSAIKRNRQNGKRQLRNRMVKSRMRTFVKLAHQAIEAGEKPAAEDAVRSAIGEIDRAAQKGVLHPNGAARRKSRLMARLNAL